MVERVGLKNPLSKQTWFLPFLLLITSSSTLGVTPGKASGEKRFPKTLHGDLQQEWAEGDNYWQWQSVCDSQCNMKIRKKELLDYEKPNYEFRSSIDLSPDKHQNGRGKRVRSRENCHEVDCQVREFGLTNRLKILPLLPNLHHNCRDFDFHKRAR